MSARDAVLREFYRSGGHVSLKHDAKARPLTLNEAVEVGRLRPPREFVWVR